MLKCGAGLAECDDRRSAFHACVFLPFADTVGSGDLAATAFMSADVGGATTDAPGARVWAGSYGHDVVLRRPPLQNLALRAGALAAALTTPAATGALTRLFNALLACPSLSEHSAGVLHAAAVVACAVAMGPCSPNRRCSEGALGNAAGLEGLAHLLARTHCVKALGVRHRLLDALFGCDGAVVAAVSGTEGRGRVVGMPGMGGNIASSS
jgi:hypothetical protein